MHLNWQEIDPDLPLDVNWRLYRLLEREGVLHAGYVLEDDTLVGYTVWFVEPPLHSQKKLWATNDEVYLDPERRKGRLGVWLIREAERYLKALGVDRITYWTKPEGRLGSGERHGSVGDLLAALEYVKGEEAWWKNL